MAQPISRTAITAPEQHPQLRTHGADDDFPVGLDVDAVVAAELLRQADADGAHLVRRAFDRDPRLHPRVGDEEVIAATGRDQASLLSGTNTSARRCEKSAGMMPITS